MYQVGIDISKTKFDACLLIDGKTKAKTFGNSFEGFNGLISWLAEHGATPAHVCMEGTGRLWEPLAEFLAERKYLVSVVNPVRIKGFAQSEMRRSKTDKIDAKIIARFCRAQTPTSWVPAPPEIKALRDMQRYVEVLKDNKARESKRLGSSAVIDERVHRAIQEHIAYLDRQIEALETEIFDLIEAHEKLNRDFGLLITIIGVGQTTAATFIGELAGATTFGTSRQIEVFCGIAPRLFESGSSVRSRSRMSKVGNARVRKALYMPALAAMRTNPVLRDFADRLRAAGKPGRVVVCAVMRKLLRIMFAVLKSGQAFDLNFRSARPSQVARVH